MPILPRSPAEQTALLEAFLLEKSAYELAYELNNRPTWVRIALRGILERLGPPAPSGEKAPAAGGVTK